MVQTFYVYTISQGLSDKNIFASLVLKRSNRMGLQNKTKQIYALVKRLLYLVALPQLSVIVKHVFKFEIVCNINIRIHV